MRICNSCEGTGVTHIYGQPRECVQCRPASPETEQFSVAAILAMHYYRRGKPNHHWYWMLRWAQAKYDLVHGGRL